MTESQKQSYRDTLDSRVLSDDIHSLLKKYKEENKEVIRLSGTKSDLIENLFEAISENIIQLSEVQELIKDAEEFGDQYIYLYIPNDSVSSTKFNEIDRIRDEMIPANVDRNFPRIMEKPDQLEWVDFRAPNRGVPNSWLVKMYDKKVREVKESEEFNPDTNLRTVTYRKKEDRLVYIVQWDGDSELSIKITRTTFDSVKSLKSTKRLISQLIVRGADIEREFSYFDLTDNINNILINSETNQNIYTLMSANLIDESMGNATFNSFGEEELDLLSDPSRKEAIKQYLENGGKASSVVIMFLAAGSNNELTKDVHVVLGKDFVNEVIISRQISPREYKYVRRKIGEFN